MTLYEFRDIWGLWHGDFDSERGALEAFGPMWPSRRICALHDDRMTVSGDSAGLREIGVYAAFVAAAGGHVHLECEPGVEFTIDHASLLGDKRREARFNVLRYEARPVLVRAPDLETASKCRSSFFREEGATAGEFWVSGESEALLYLAERALDLAEAATPVGAEVAFSPSRNLSPDSHPFTLRRL